MRDAFNASSAVFVSPHPVRPRPLRRSCEQSQHVVIARGGDRVLGTARLLSDGVRNAYRLDVSTTSSHRRQGIGSGVIRLPCERVPGQHVGPRTEARRPSASRSASGLSRSSGRVSSASGSTMTVTADGHGSVSVACRLCCRSGREMARSADEPHTAGCDFIARPRGATTMQTDAHNMGRDERRAQLERRRAAVAHQLRRPGDRISGPRQTLDEMIRTVGALTEG